MALRASRSNDHAPEFRRVAISAFASWFASGGYGHSVLPNQFLRGYFGGHDLGDMSTMLEEVLRACGMQETQLGELVAGILKVGEKWGLEMSRYGDRVLRRIREQPSCPGHVMQIFVHTSVVDAVVYGAVPLGRPLARGVPVSAWLARQCPLNGQVRILLHPDLFLHSERGLVHVFTHSGSPLYGPVQRQRMLQDLDALIAQPFSEPAACERARIGLGFCDDIDSTCGPGESTSGQEGSMSESV